MQPRLLQKEGIIWYSERCCSFLSWIVVQIYDRLYQKIVWLHFGLSTLRFLSGGSWKPSYVESHIIAKAISLCCCRNISRETIRNSFQQQWDCSKASQGSYSVISLKKKIPISYATILFQKMDATWFILTLWSMFHKTTCHMIPEEINFRLKCRIFYAAYQSCNGMKLGCTTCIMQSYLDLVFFESTSYRVIIH